ncbi:cupin-like domain-containing protein [Sphingomonas sp.]|uniref:cupin-like domain-containing protein n=1 Tax=Sphingomonas sp. TaxID=28214 RepID=UPI002C773389|nr:cupin-like domain-containing protein [Sphingomonas sp.]HTG38158.1 cupin-like domain-containing protein [Sphingomonas sp.]
MTAPVDAIEASAVADESAFAERVARACRPVVLKGACRDWPVTVAARRSDDALFAYLAALASDRPAEAFAGRADIAGRYHYGEGLEGFNFERRLMPIRAALTAIAECAAQSGAGDLYLGSLPADSYFPDFAASNALPWPPAQVTPRLWIGTASTVACHHDRFDNIACCIAGERRFTLFPPEAIGDLYVGPIDHTMAGQPVGLAVGSQPGDPRYPRFEAWRDRALVADLSPGDALYMPKLWWHQVEARGRVNLLVNYWWDAFAAGPDTPFTAMMLAMAAVAERPPGERAAWAAFFDHYVFRPDRHPLEHLPPERHGILGPLSEHRGRIRAMVMQWLRGGR